MPSRNFEIIQQAIRKRQQIHATYKGRPRQMCPHAVGYKNGREKALLYQFGGESRSGIKPTGSQTYGSPENWRCVFVRELTEVIAVDGQWHTALTYSVRQTCIDRIDVQVSD